MHPNDFKIDACDRDICRTIYLIAAKLILHCMILKVEKKKESLVGQMNKVAYQLVKGTCVLNSFLFIVVIWTWDISIQQAINK